MDTLVASSHIGPCAICRFRRTGLCQSRRTSCRPSWEQVTLASRKGTMFKLIRAPMRLMASSVPGGIRLRTGKHCAWHVYNRLPRCQTGTEKPPRCLVNARTWPTRSLATAQPPRAQFLSTFLSTFRPCSKFDAVCAAPHKARKCPGRVGSPARSRNGHRHSLGRLSHAQRGTEGPRVPTERPRDSQ